MSDVRRNHFVNRAIEPDTARIEPDRPVAELSQGVQVMADDNEKPGLSQHLVQPFLQP